MSKKNNNLTLSKTLRQHSLCGQCQSSTFMGGWDDDVPSSDLPNLVIENETENCSYVVRCDYLRITIPAPEAIEFCEAFKEIKK